MNADNLRIPALAVTVLAWAVAGLSIIAAFAKGLWLLSYSQFAEANWMLIVAGGAAALENLVFLASIIAVMCWVYIAHDNLHRAKLTGLNYSPGWATFSFLVPIANLFVPMRAMRELANRSAGEPEELAEADVNEVQAWWAPWLGSLFFGMFIVYTQLVDLVPWLWITTPFWATEGIVILTDIFLAVSAFFLIRVVKLVTHSQQAGVSAVATFE